jgi:branched-chain amino acid transport system substrate-binding protein
MIRKSVLTTVILFLSALLLLDFALQEAKAAEPKPPVKIGSAGPMSGPSASDAQQYKNAELLAVEEWNAAGGILGGRKIEYIGPLDDRSVPEEGVTVVRKLLAQGCSGLLLSLNSSVGLAQNPVVISSKVNAIHPVSMHPRCVSVKDGIFGFNADLPQVNKAHLEWLVNNLKMTSIYMISELTDYGQLLLDTYTAGFKKHGVEVKGADRVEFNETDYSIFVSKAQKSRAQYIQHQLATIGQMNIFLRECLAQGVPIAKVLFTANMDFVDLIKVQGAYLNGAVTTGIWAQDMGRFVPEYEAFAAKFQKRFGEPVSTKYAMLGYEAAWMMIKAMDMAGSDKNHEAWTKAMLQLQWNSPRGKCKIDPSLGRPYPTMFLSKIENGKVITTGIAWQAPELK